MTLEKEKLRLNTILSNKFIDTYMNKAIPLYVMVYIQGLRCNQEKDKIDGIQDMAKKLNMLESDVINAWKYWESEKLIKIKDDSVKNFSIEFCLDSVEKLKPKEENNFRIKLATQPSYSPQEIDIYMQRSEEIRGLFKTAENIFAKPLTYTELNMLLTFFEWYALPFDVIEVMLEYCVSNNKRGKNYLEAVARDWSENEIDTVEAARDYIDTFTIYAKILKAFGITGKTPNQKQIKFMKKWLHEFKLPFDVIAEACETTFLQTGKARFEYADKMLTDWHKNQVITIEDVKKANEEFHKNKDIKNLDKANNTTVQFNRPGYKNRFINYEQREWDYDKIEKLAMEQLK